MKFFDVRWVLPKADALVISTITGMHNDGRYLRIGAADQTRTGPKSLEGFCATTTPQPHECFLNVSGTSLQAEIVCLSLGPLQSSYASPSKLYVKMEFCQHSDGQSVAQNSGQAS